MRRSTLKIAVPAALAALLVAGWLRGFGTAEAAAVGTAAQTAMAANGATHDAAADYVWNAADVVPVTLTGSGASSTGANVSISGSTVTITAVGTYQLTGNLSNGSVVVNSAGTGTVRLILNGVTLANSTTSPLQINDADKAMIVLAAGTTNTISDATSYVYPDATTDEPNAAVFSKANLTITGTGSLTVRGNAYDGIASKDGLILHSGNITVNAVDDGVRGKDYLVVAGGTTTVTAGGDGLKSDEDADATLGYVLLSAGTVNITATGDGVSGETDVLVNGGTVSARTGGGSTATVPADASAKGLKASVNVIVSAGQVTANSADDGLNSNNAVIIDGGTVTVATNDDGIHADNTLDIIAGTVNVTGSYEGLEALKLTVSGGDVSATARDDAFNAVEEGLNEFAVAPNAYIRIFGGNVVVDGGTDGLDSNGTMTLSGGTVVVKGSGTRGGGEGGLDSNGALTFTGGTIFSSGVSATTITPVNTSQPYVSTGVSSVLAAGTIVHIATTSGTALVAYRGTKSFQRVLFSSNQLTAGQSYDLYTGGSVSGTGVGGLYPGGSLSGATRVATVTAVGSGTATRPPTTAPTAAPTTRVTTAPTTRATTAPTTRATTVPTTRATVPTTVPTSVSTTGPGTRSCTATYAIVGQWTGGFQGEVRVTAGTAAVTAWTVTWTYANGQTVTQSWGATITPNGSAITARNVAYNGSLAAGASTTFGFIGSWNGTNAVPTAACTAT